MQKRSWTEIDLGIIRSNFDIYSGAIANEKMRIMPVVKADAYGHGDIEIAKMLQYAGVKQFAVSNIDETLHLRVNGINGKILVLGYTPVSMAKELFEHRITQTILSAEYAEDLKIAAADLPIECHAAIDTGMNRIGLNADTPLQCAKVIRRYLKCFAITGIFTHLCVADSMNAEDDAFTENQIEKFQNVVEQLQDIRFEYIHCMNSAGGLYSARQYGNMLILGIVMYGLKPDYLNIIPTGIKPALSWKSVISMVKTVYAGEYIGYGRTYEAHMDMQMATITTGYADGYPRSLSNLGYVLIDGSKANIVGRICMDQFMVDVSEIQDVHIGKEVVLLGKSGELELNADGMARMAGTIGYEIVCGISKRVPRKYVH